MLTEQGVERVLSPVRERWACMKTVLLGQMLMMDMVEGDGVSGPTSVAEREPSRPPMLSHAI